MCFRRIRSRERDDDALFFVFFFSVSFGSEEDAERRAEKTERG
jgi:hypothetical protein